MRPHGQFNKGIDARRNDTGLRRAEPGRPGRLGVRSLAARVLTAVLLAAFAALLALPAQAQTITTLVSNTGQATGQQTLKIVAQPFTTGGESGGYTLTSVGVGIVGTDAAGYLVRIVPNASNDRPDESDSTKIISLTTPASLTANAINTFTAPANTTLAANTTYHIIVSNPKNTQGSLGVLRTNSTSEDSGAADGWSIENRRYYKDSITDLGWTTSNVSFMRIQVNGFVGGTSTDVTLSDPYIRSILVPYDLELGEKALPEEEITVWAGPPFEEDMYVVAEGDRWSPSGVWGDPVKDMIWVVDPIHFGIHALKLSALKDGRIERYIAAGTSEFDYRFNYNCHFKRTRASGEHGNPALTVMWGDGSTIWVANDESGQLDAYRRNGSLTSECYTQNVTVWTANSPTTATENFKTPFTRDTNRDYSLQTGGPLTVRGIWSDGEKIWVSGPPGDIYTIDIGTGHVVEAPGFDGHYDAYGLWSDGTTMWVATGEWLRAYHLHTGIRRAALDVRLRGNQTPGDMWSDGTTIWITYHSGSIEVYRLPERSGGVSQATEAEPLTASFASVPEGHDGESGFTFRIAFSEEVEITPEDMRDHALVLSGGTVTDAAGVDGRKDLWELTVEPTSTGPVSILVLQGRACTETGALCTADGRSLTSSLALRVAGPQAEPVNSPATGRPTISGTAQVRETLTADTSGIGDADGLTNVAYSYQWLANDGTSDTDIAGETDSSYTLAASDEGKTIKVRVSFTDDAANEETLTSAATAEVAGEVTAGVRAEPPGAPRNLTGAANADGTVTLSWDAPNDDSVTGYQILRRRPREGEGTLLVHVNDTGSTATEYTDTDVTADVLHAYRVKAINAVGLSRRSNFVNMTPALPAEPAQNSPATGRPAISGTTQVGETLTADTTGIGDADGLTNVAYSYQWIANDATSDTDIQDATGSTHTLVSDDEGKTIKVRVTFTDDAGDGESLTSTATAMVTARPNTPATGALIISGTAQVGETLTADTSGIGDADGLTNVAYSYQWLANDGTSDTDIAGETDSSHTLAAADEGKTIKVRVSFTDDAANEETLTSTATAEVVAAAPTEPPGAPRNLTGAANADGTVTLSWDAPNDDSVTGYQILRRRPREGEGTLLVHVNDTGSTATEYTDTDVTADVLHAYRVKAINAVGLSRRSNFVNMTPALPAEPAQNSPATGRPAISGTTQVGETLTADTTGIGDADGLGNVTFSYQWLADDVAIQGETGSGYTLASSDAGKTIKVTVSFTDDAGNPESLTSVATPAVTDTAPTERPPAPENLTAVENAGGSVTLTWDAPGDDSVTGYQILRREPAAGENSVSVYVADTGSAATSFTDTDVAAGTKYVYRVKAINDAGVGPQSGRVMITTND